MPVVVLSVLGDHLDVEYAISTPPREWFEENLVWITNDEELEDLLHMGNQITNTKNLNRTEIDSLNSKKPKGLILWVDSNRIP